jgi:regulator of cell morphogenesis and NO signaling
MEHPAAADRVAALIAHILARFHETHRAELPELVALAKAHAPGLLGPLQDLAVALELHMFKEEARLFPMMEQGGNTLIGHLIDDLSAEHRQHEVAVARLKALLRGPTPAALRQGLDKLLADLQAHVQVEDEELFPLFAPR